MKRRRITVQELFCELNKEDVLDAFGITYGIKADDYMLCKNSLEEKIKIAKKELSMMGELIDKIRTCETDKKDRVLFVLKVKDAAFLDYDDRNRRVLSSFFVYPEDVPKAFEEMRKSDKKEKHLFAFLNHYGYDFCPLEEIAGMQIADTVMEETEGEREDYRECVSLLEIATEILEEASIFGFDEEVRTNKIESIIKECDDAMRNIKERESRGERATVPAEEVFRELEKSHLASLKTEDEKQYYLLNREFQEKTKEIRNRAVKEILEETEEKTIKMIKKEFKIKDPNDKY